MWLGQPDKLVVAEQRFNQDHHIQLQDTKALSTICSYMDWPTREVTELELYPYNMNDAEVS
jgi:hypothetical protein